MAGEGLSWDWKPALPEGKAHALHRNTTLNNTRSLPPSPSTSIPGTRRRLLLSAQGFLLLKLLRILPQHPQATHIPLRCASQTGHNPPGGVWPHPCSPERDKAGLLVLRMQSPGIHQSRGFDPAFEGALVINRDH